MSAAAQQTDVLVIGGGVVGLCSAYYLQKRGYGVTVLEQCHVGAGASPGNAGHIVPSHVVPLAAPGVVKQSLRWMLNPSTSPFAVKLRLDPAFLSWLWQFGAACNEQRMRRAIPMLHHLGYTSARLFTELLAAEELSCGYEQRGLLNVYKTQQALEAAAQEAEFLRSHGVGVAVLDRTALHRLEPSLREDVIGAVHFLDDAHLHPALFLGQMKDLLQKRGAVIAEGTKVTGFNTGAHRIEAVQTETGTFTAKHVVLAAGVWSPLVSRGLNLKLPVQPGKGYSMTMPRPQGSPQVPMILGERKVAVTSMGEWLRFTGRLELTPIDETVDARQIEAIRGAARDYLRLDSDLTPTETWSGMRPTTPDGVPIISKTGRFENLVIATGHAMLGLSLGPVTGHLVAQLVSGEQPDFDTTLLQASRFG